MSDPTDSDADAKPMRLAKFLAHAGVASRRDSEKLITAGRVRVNGEVMSTLPGLIDPDVDTVEFDGQLLTKASRIHLLLHKPPGYTCTARDPHARRLALDLIPQAREQHLFTVGRLDRESEGVILVTNDGELTNRLLHPRYGVLKVYHCTVAGEVTKADLQRLEAGIQDGEDFLQAKSVATIGRFRGDAVLEIVLAEGKKREVRRLCASCSWDVMRLIRVSFGPINLGDLEPGMSRPLTAPELASLKAAATDPTAAGGKRSR